MDADSYARLQTSSLSPLLQEILDYTNLHHPQAHMISGQVQGLFLQMISRVMQPHNILEIGTFTGFSALCLAEGLKPEGELHTIELRASDAEVAQTFFHKSPRGNQIKLHVGSALDILPGLNQTWDLVFIDADKTAYIHYYELVKHRISPHGLIIADNVLFHGQVLQEPPKGKNARAMADFAAHVQADPMFRQVLLTVRDGLLLIQRA